MRIWISNKYQLYWYHWFFSNINQTPFDPLWHLTRCKRKATFWTMVLYLFFSIKCQQYQKSVNFLISRDLWIDFLHRSDLIFCANLPKRWKTGYGTIVQRMAFILHLVECHKESNIDWFILQKKSMVSYWISIADPDLPGSKSFYKSGSKITWKVRSNS